MARFQVNGIAVHVEQAGPAGAPAVLMSSSLAADLTMWEAQARHLARNYRVIRFDTRGHGKTEASDGDYSLEILAEDVLMLLDRLEIGRAHFIGLSLGGMIGQFLGAHAPHRLLSLVLCATFASSSRKLWDERARIARRSGMASLVEPTIERWLTPSFRAARPDVVEQIRAMILATSPRGYAGCAAAIRDMELEQLLPLITVPTLLVAAAGDPSATPEMMAAMQARIRGARLVVIQEAAHLFTVEQPDRAAEIMASFLGEAKAGMDAGFGGARGAAAKNTRLG